MAQVLLFHHALGLTEGVLAFADQLREAGHEVTTPDLYDGWRFTDLEEGVEHAEELGFETVIARGEAAAEALPTGLVYAGFSLGALPAQKLTQTRAGAQAAILYHAGVPTDTFGTDWPAAVPLQLHLAEEDPWGELDVAEELAATIDTAELYLYRGSGHLFTDASVDDHDPDLAGQVMERTLALLARL